MTVYIGQTRQLNGEKCGKNRVRRGRADSIQFNASWSGKLADYCGSVALNLNESLDPRPSQLNAQTVNLLIWQAKLEAALQNKPINL